MQPTVICTAATTGMIYLNGRFAGEASRERPLFAPVSPCGALYLEYRPLSGNDDSLARRLVLSDGKPLPESLAGAEGMSCVAWPGGALEVELFSPRHTVECFELEGMFGSIARGERTTLSLNGFELELPDGAMPPRLLRTEGAAALLGDMDGGGRYLAALTADLTEPLGTVTADTIEPAGGGIFNAIVSAGDRVGHGRLEQWLVDAGGLSLASSEIVWSHGAPRWPETAEDTVIAAVEAALEGLDAEADEYLSPALAAARPLDAVREACELCAPMKYGLPDARPCVALLKAVNTRLVAVRPLYYLAAPSGGRQGPWRIESLSLL